ncbi:MAG: hypothetical protein IMW83_03970 [Caldanaerobacter subterraneus]|nr:hypothetical protein [Caldanaerobacter subterraneus]
MGTRGAYGFYKSGITKVTYNHSDSYPSGLGKNIIEFIKETSVEEMNKIFDSIILVNEDDTPSFEQIKEVSKVIETEVYNIISWYELLRPVQGDLNIYKKGLRYMIDNAEFLKNSAFCEWAYIINPDKNVLEIYRGFQKKPQRNRYYTKEKCCNCYNVALIIEMPIEAIKKGNIEDLISKIEEKAYGELNG